MHLFSLSRRVPYIHNVIIRTGLASVPEIPALDKVGNNILLPPFVNEMVVMQEEDLRKLLLTHIPIFLHNSLVAKNFPTNTSLKNIFISSEKKMRRIKDNPWMKMLMELGKHGECPGDMEELEILLQEKTIFDRVALQISRAQWEDIVPKIIVNFTDWFVKNRVAVDKWYIHRLDEIETGIFQKI
ncbi:hypothetical protein [Microbulbifer epialgicus]|uniref:Nucleotidyl transferase AbiEii toxin, Type IV TA system n=1 Tax=Microbulbifer epialgicus TaxID=393907 RepID=A0ABV4NU97_9GAMM